jgi:hypothetical protein
MGKLSSIDYGCEKQVVCSHCGMQDKKGCCHSEFKTFKISGDQQTAKEDNSIAPVDAAMSSFAANLLTGVQGITKKPCVDYNSPPDDPGPAIYLQDCIFRI